MNVCSLLWKFRWAEVPDIPWPSFLEHFLLAIELYNITLLYGVVCSSVSLSLDVSSLVLYYFSLYFVSVIIKVVLDNNSFIMFTYKKN